MAGKEKNGNLKKISLIIGIIVSSMIILGYIGSVFYKAANVGAQVTKNAESCIRHCKEIEKLRVEKAGKDIVEKVEEKLKIHTRHINTRLIGLENNLGDFQKEMRQDLKDFQKVVIDAINKD